MANHKINLTNGAANILAQILSTPGIVNNSVDFYRIGGVVEDHLSSVPEAPKSQGPMEDWAKTPYPEFEVKENHRKACAAAITAAIEKGMIGSNKHTRSLQREFGCMTGDD